MKTDPKNNCTYFQKNPLKTVEVVILMKIEENSLKIKNSNFKIMFQENEVGTVVEVVILIKSLGTTDKSAWDPPPPDRITFISKVLASQF